MGGGPDDTEHPHITTGDNLHTHHIILHGSNVPVGLWPYAFIILVYILIYNGGHGVSHTCTDNTVPEL
jgi:hypothetical protein